MSIQSIHGNPNLIASGGADAAQRVVAVAGKAPPPATAPVAATVPAASTPSDGDVRKAAEKVQQAVQSLARNLQFSIDEESGKTIVKLTDAETGETIRQFPSEEMVALSHQIDRLQGLLLKQQA